MKKLFFYISFLMIFIDIKKAEAFPEMIRHHYVNCIACHESPSGGGLLNGYGRTISAEVLSTWGNTNEARPFYGALDHQFLKKWFNIGGNLRALQLKTENSQMKRAMFIRMQTGVESSIKMGNLKLVAFFGKQEQGNMVRGEFTRFYSIYQLTDELTLRAGRFIPNFGLNIAEHTLATRKGLGFDEGSERDQVELMWGGEKWNSSLTLSKQINTRNSNTLEKAASFQVNYNFLDSYRVGADLWLGDRLGKKRQIIGGHAVLGFSEKIYYLTEFNLQKDFNNNHGLFHFSKFGYEFVKGLHFIVLEDYKKNDLKNEKTLANSHGVGLEWYPRPHFEFEGIMSKKRVAAQSSEYSDYAYLMMHYYF
jgi:hypothetical protein